ncbi:MAG: NAD(P)H-dependent oxidoreductase subunit E [Dethiobacteria bacterium]|jgi:NADH-quinone oxidoreductase subunit E
MKKTAIKTEEKQKDQYRELNNLLQKYKGREGILLKVLQEAQEIFGYLPREVLIHIACELDLPFSEVYSVVSFYEFFRTKATGRYHLEICSGTACYINGMKDLLGYLEENLSLKDGISADKMFSVSTSNCMGVCSAAPVLKIGGELYGEMTLERLGQLLKGFKEDEKVEG